MGGTLLRPGARILYAIHVLIGQLHDGKYRIIRLLGQGGMGAVYEAEHAETGEHVALKCMDGSLLVPGKSSVERFHREAKAMGAMDTEHIVRVLDSGTDPETKAPYLVMDLLEGEDLQQLLDRIGCLEPDTALRIAAQVCLGLQKAHEAGVVHRDIKPANLFLARHREGEIIVRILDFGIAKIKREPHQVGPTTGLTRTGGILGSPLYMSPEQARGISDIDYRTDIWSLGMVLYRALAGKLPYEHIGGFGDLIIAICSQPPPSIQALAPWVRTEAASVVHGALRLDTGERFPTAAAMLDALRSLLPDGFDLRDELLVPVSVATRAAVTAPLPAVRTADDADRPLVSPVVRGELGDDDTTIVAESPSLGSSTTVHVEPWRLVAQHTDYILASWRQIFCVIWRQETTEEGVRRFSDACKKFSKQHPRGIGLLTVIERGASFPPARVREAISAFLAEASAFVRCSAVVVEGAGFQGAAMRSIVTGLTLVARQRYPHRVCDLRKAALMFAESLPAATGVDVSDDAFRASLDRLRETVGRR
ncbi:serine/threonine protein kinase [Sorangium sp. So ce394]|uniref:serine/threonine protein kinase n=1 Tax=Sorangium sp. So ce394 TaxID=3133310 RepID=UPI003F5B4FF7